MKIAFLGLGRYSGASPIPLHLAAALSERHTLRVFLGSESLNLADWRATGMDLDVREVYRSIPGALWSLVSRRRIRALADLIEDFAPDVVLVPFFHLWHPLLVGMVRRPFVVFVHDPQPHPGIGGMVYHALERRLVSRARRVLIHSTAFLPLMRSRYGVDPELVTVVPIGPLTGYGSDSQQTSGSEIARSTGVRFLCFGRITSYKGIDVLLDAVPTLRQRVPQAVVSIVGGGGPSALLDRARATPGVQVDNRWVDDAEIRSVFAQADVVVLPYTNATQSGVIPLAAAFGLPVVATRTGGLSEQLCEGRCGVLVEPGDSRALADAMIGLAVDRERAKRLGQALFDEYSARRSWSAIAEAVAAACEVATGN